MMTFEQVVNELRSYDKEKEWFEFKENWFSADELGEYISALANSAAIEGKSMHILSGVSMIRHMRLSEQASTLTRILIMSL